MQAFEAIDLIQLVTVTGGETPGTQTTVKGGAEGSGFFGTAKASANGEFSQQTSNDVALFDRTVGCMDKRSEATCLDILRTIKGQPTQPQPQ